MKQLKQQEKNKSITGKITQLCKINKFFCYAQNLKPIFIKKSNILHKNLIPDHEYLFFVYLFLICSVQTP